MKKVHVLPNAITAFGLSCGLFVIFRMTLAECGELSYNVQLATVGFLLLAALADLFDGAVARIMKAESEFGGIFDSLSDSITFGVAPAVVVLRTITPAAGSETSYLLIMAAMVFSICGVLRLARYSSTPPLPAYAEEGKKKNFTGLPIPAACMAVVSSNLFLLSPELTTLVGGVSEELRASFMIGIFIVLGYFMISRWKFPSMQSLHVRVASFQLVFLTVLSVVFIFYGLLHHFAVVFVAVAWTYVVTAWIFSIVRLVGGKDAKILEDYEPDNDDTEL